MQQELECHIFGIMLTAINSGRGRHGHFFVEGLELALAPKNFNVLPPITGLQRGQ